MLEVVLHDRAAWRAHLLPLASTRPVGDLRVGILTFSEKWQLLLHTHTTFYTETYLQEKFNPPGPSSIYLVIQGNLCPSIELLKALVELPVGSVLVQGEAWLAYKSDHWSDESIIPELAKIEFVGKVDRICFLEDVYLKNAEQLLFDYELLTSGKKSAELDASNRVLGDRLFIADDVRACCSTFNTEEGPIYIGEGAIIEEGSHIKGPVSIGKGARVKMGCRLYPNVSIGPNTTVAGEVNNTVMWGNCAKGHDGYLGCAVIGEECNIGAGSSNSNLQNNWMGVKVYDYGLSDLRDSALPKLGVFMGDFSMCGINSSLTTGCVIGVGTQIAMSNIIPKFVPDFSWVTDGAKEPYNWDKFVDMLRARAIVKKESVNDKNVQILKEVHRRTFKERKNYISTLKK